MPVLRFEPIANQISKWVSAAELLPPNVLEEVRAGTDLNRGEHRLPAHTQEFVCHYFALVKAGNDLLGAPPFERLARLHEQIEEEYMPGGPPMSPVYDSFSLQHVLGEVPHGAGDETPYSVLARLTASDPRYSDFHALAQALSAAHLDLYRVTGVEAVTAEIELVRRAAPAPAPFTVHLTGPFLRTNDRMLARVVPFRGKSYISDSPYLLRASEQEWLEYFERVVAAHRGRGPAPAGHGNAQRSKGKAAAKQQARGGGAPKAAQKVDPEQVIRRHLKRGPSERFWLDYVMEAYAGERNGIVFVAGVPDRPEQLPHSKHYAPEKDASEVAEVVARSRKAGESPVACLRAALIQIAKREGLVAGAHNELRRACEHAGLPTSAPAEHELHLFTAYCTLGARSARGLTALEHLESEHSDLDAELQRTVEALKRGWFSVLRVDRIHLDQGLELFDTLRRKKLRVSERSGTRQLALGDVLLGWLCENDEGVFTLEGGVMCVPALLAPQFVELAKALRDAAPRGMDFRTRASQLPLTLIAAVRAVYANPSLPRLFNTSGHALNLVTARYEVLDRPATLAGLERAFEPIGDDSFGWFEDAAGDARDDVRAGLRDQLAELELSGDRLLVRVNSVERLSAVKSRIHAALGGAVKPSLDAYEQDVAETVRARAARGGGGPAAKPPAELPPEIRSQLHTAVIQQIRTVLDQPIPQLGNKTLREVARRERTRPDAVSWLREQERVLKSNPQMHGLDMRPLWRDLGLEYQGLEMDPPLRS